MVTLSSKDRAIHHRLKVAAVTDFWAFLDLINFKGGTSQFGDCHKELAAFVAENTLTPRRLILMPRGHLKSTLCSVALVLWRIYQNPDIRILVGTATKPLATSFVREVKQYFEDDELQTTVWNARPHMSGNLIPKLDGQARKAKSKRNVGDDDNFEEEFTEAEDKKVVWKADALQVVRTKIMKEPTLVASSVGSPATGFHYDLAIFDDLVSFDNSDTEEKLLKIINWVGDVESVVDPFNEITSLGGEFIMLGTRYFYKDIYGIYTGEDLSEDEKEERKDLFTGKHDLDEYAVYKKNIYKNGVDSSDGMLWDERFSEPVIERIKKRMLKLPNGLRRFASQYLNSIMTDDEVVLDPTYLSYIHSVGIISKEDGTVDITVDNKPVRVKLFCIIDPAISQRKTADNTAIVIGGADEYKNMYLVDLKFGKFSPNEVINNTYELVDKWHMNTVHIDSEKLGKALVYAFKQQFSTRRVLSLREYKAEGDKKARINTFLEPLFTNRKLFLVQWMASCSQLQEEIAFFPRQGAKDDIIDAIAMLVHICVPTKSRLEAGKRRRNQTYTINRKYGGTR